MILFCFHYAGGTASVYKNFCSDKIVPIQLPGRENRHAEPFYKNLEDAVQGCFLEIKHYILQHNVQNYGFVAHSMGTWIAYGVYKLMEKKPQLMVLSCFPSPTYANNQNKIWRINKNLSDIEFQDELRKWGVREIVFQDKYWSVFRNILRADFNLFDNYNGSEIKIIDIPKLILIHATDDMMISKDMVMDWVDLAGVDTEIKFHEIKGKHLFMEDKECRKEWENIVLRYV